MLLRRLTNRQDPSVGTPHESNSDSSDYESAGEDLCSPSGAAPAAEAPAAAEPTCSYGRMGILSHVSKGLLRPARVDNGSSTTKPSTPHELPPHPPDATVRWEHPATGKVHILDKRNVVSNINTGEMFLLPTGSDGLVHELSSGRSISFDEFEAKIGLHPQEGTNHRRSSSNDTADSSHGEPTSLSRKIKRLASKLKSTKALSAPASPMTTTTTSMSLTAEVLPVASPPQGPPMPDTAVRVKATVHKKMYKELSELYLVQEVLGHRRGSVVWTMRFSPNGNYLASAGQDCEVLVWEVLRGGDTDSPGSPGSPLLSPTPHRQYKGHSADVLDVCWSKKGGLFLLSASMDYSVRLWHISMDACLSVFSHTDYVTSLDFHPVNEHFFLSGSMDGKVRIWNIPSNKVADFSDVHDMITAVTFSPDGRKVVVGTMKGKCRFYTCEQDFKLEYEAQIGVKNRSGKHTGGKKITGLQYMPGAPSRLLITTNDSRLRLYEGYSLLCKFKGLCNIDSQIKACFSSDGVYVLCGSDNGAVCLWRTCNACSPGKGRTRSGKTKNSSVECFPAFPKTTTVAIFGPEGLRPTTPTEPEHVAWIQEHSKGGTKWHSVPDCGAEQLSAAEAAMCQARAMGRLIVAAGYSGEIKVFENVGWPRWV